MDQPSDWYVFSTALALAYDSIRAHRMRSFLTLLGVILGVASVVIVGSALQGLGTYTVDSTTKAFGGDNFLIAKIAAAGNISRREYTERLKYNRDIGFDDLAYLKQALSNDVIFTSYNQRSRDIKFGEQTLENTNILGVSSTFPEIRDIVLDDGRFFTEQEENSKQSVCVIGQDVRDAFFPGSSPLGKTIKVIGQDFYIVGMQERLGSAFGRSQDNQIYIPASLFSKMFGARQQITVFGRARPGSGLTLDQALDETRQVLRVRFKTQPGKPDNFDNLTPDAILGFLGNIVGLISAIVLPVTAISLVVGGIVIMNIMLVSVAERTREIGIRKSIGARSGDIQLQVLLEAMVLSLVGGLFGIVLAWVLTFGISKGLGINITMSPAYALLGVVVSTGVGLISGWYPARRASRLDPIVALRQE